MRKIPEDEENRWPREKIEAGWNEEEGKEEGASEKTMNVEEEEEEEEEEDQHARSSNE